MGKETKLLPSLIGMISAHSYILYTYFMQLRSYHQISNAISGEPTSNTYICNAHVHI